VQNILENYIPTAIATLIEPIWILINRLLCLLQPLEELHNRNAIAEKSIDKDYSSLPPQLVVLKALKSRHYTLAAVCTMALLANLLAVSFAGLFNEALIDIQRPATLQLPYNFNFVPVNGSIGPAEGRTFGSDQASGAYRGGQGEDQFMIAESNFTRNTPLPAWTDDSLFYLPFLSEVSSSAQTMSSRFEASTRVVGADLDCSPLEVGKNISAAIDVDPSNTPRTIRVSMNFTLVDDLGNVNCTRFWRQVPAGPIRPLFEKDNCSPSPSSLELLSPLVPLANATKREKELCLGTTVFAWMRFPQGSCSVEASNGSRIDKERSLFITCRPKLVTGAALIQVDAYGRLQKPVEDTKMNLAQENDKSPIHERAKEVIAQSSLYLFRTGFQSAFHNDSFANDYLNHFIIRGSGDRRLIDPTKPAPTFSEVIGPLRKAYSTLFAIWLGNNKKNLFEIRPSESPVYITGSQIDTERRLFLSSTMFIISEVILCTYALVIVWVYARRPGQYLPRLPTSIAAIIALFAASSAVQDMKGTSHFDSKARAQHLKRIGARYAYGSYIGADGRVHIGVEKTDFVRPRTRKTWLERKLPLFRKGSV